MRYRNFGNTGLFVSELCLGTAAFGGEGGTPRTDASRLLGRAVDAGLNFIDAAGLEVAETITGQALRSLGLPREHLVIASQYAGSQDDSGPRYAVMNAVIGSLRRLRLDRIDLYRIDGFDQAAPVEETVRALEHLVLHGRLGCVGVSNRAARQIIDSLGIQAWLELDRFEPVEACSAYSGLATWSAPAADAGGKARAQALRAIAQARDVPPARIALAWLLHQESIASVVIDAGSMEQLEDQLAATRLQLSATELEALGDAGNVAAEQPGRTCAARIESAYKAGFKVRRHPPAAATA
jgi:aryl-alcohol dehydrogenase-like predicted oxidoreductase